LDEAAIDAAVRKVEKEFSPQVVHIAHSFGEDANGYAAVFFRIVVRDEDAPIPRLRELSQRLSIALMNQARTDENGPQAYFRFRSVLASARALSRVQPETQATLRRAVSSAYYALFHLLIEEACMNWSRLEQRSALGRMFPHKRMFDASSGRVRTYKTAASGSPGLKLYSVASAFCQLQQERHSADYDLSDDMSALDVDFAIGLASDAFASWHAIRKEQIAQDYLFALLFQERP
jgi:hypothetical protein